MVTVTELNRAPDGRFESLEATGTFTDPAGFSYNGAINPVQVTEEAITFTESDVTLTQTNTTASGGSVELSGSQTSGNVIVGWDSGVPADLDSYDLATFQRTLDSETVTVDVLTSPSTVDNFEDGNITIETSGWTGWSEDTGSLTAQSDTVIDGSFSAELTSNDAFTFIEATKSSSFSLVALDIQIGSDTGNSSDNVSVDIADPSQTATLASLEFQDSTKDIILKAGSNTNVGTWSAGDTISVEFQLDNGNDQLTLLIDGNTVIQNEAYTTTGTSNELQIENVTNGSGVSRELYFDNISSGGFGVVFDDISPNFDISTIDTSKEVKLRANLSRSNTSNNPTVDYLARRFNRS